MTPLDRAEAAMAAGGEAEARAFYAALRAAELAVVLEDDAARLAVLETGEGPVALAFDTELRMTDFLGSPAAYASMSGRRLAELLAGQGVALGLNLGAPSETLLPPAALDWLAAMRPEPATRAELRAQEIAPPAEVPGALLTALDRALAAMAGLAPAAWLVAAVWEDGSRTPLLALPGIPAAAEAGVAEAVAEALAFAGLDRAALDVAFPDPALAARLERVGLRFDIPAPDAPRAADPAAPPRLR